MSGSYMSRAMKLVALPLNSKPTMQDLIDVELALSPRQRKTRDMLMRGMTNKEIARSMGVSHRTVEDHRANINAAYGTDNIVKIMCFVYGITENTKPCYYKQEVSDVDVD